MRAFLRTAFLLAALLLLLHFGEGQNLDGNNPVSDLTEQKACLPGEGLTPTIYRPEGNIPLIWQGTDLPPGLPSFMDRNSKHRQDCFHVHIRVIREKYLQYAPSILHRLCLAEILNASGAEPDFAYPVLS